MIFLNLLFLTAACTQAPQAQSTPIRPTSTAIPAAALSTGTPLPGATATATQTINGGLFLRVHHSTDVLHLKCDPLEIIFDVTVKDPNVKGVMFFFRMKDKPTGLVNGWSNGESMRAVGNNVFEFNFRAGAIPQEARYKDAWLQYQFVGTNQQMESIGQSQIFSQVITFSPACP